MKSWADDGCVYFIEAPEVGRVKIGFTADHPGIRLAALSTASPVELESLGVVLGGKAKEASLHAKFSELRFRGEWFNLNSRLRGFIRESVLPWPGPLPSLEEVLERVGGHPSNRVGIIDAAVFCGLNMIQMRSEIGRGRIAFDRPRKSEPLTATLGSVMALRSEVERREKRWKATKPNPKPVREDWRALMAYERGR